MITREFDTIAAISTPLGEGAIGIVRLSGTESFAIAQKIFKGKDLSQVASHTLNYGHIIDPLTQVFSFKNLLRNSKTFCSAQADNTNSPFT